MLEVIGLVVIACAVAWYLALTIGSRHRPPTPPRHRHRPTRPATAVTRDLVPLDRIAADARAQADDLARRAAPADTDADRATTRATPGTDLDTGAPPPVRPTDRAARSGRTRLFAPGVADPDAPGYRHHGPYAAVAIRTTGFSPMKDRIIEIAVARTDATGRATDCWDTLLDPGGRAPGPQFLHGLDAGQVDCAPTFDQIAPHLIRLLEGHVVVVHHTDVVEHFLAAEFLRAGVLAPSLPTLSTARAAQQRIPTANHRLRTLAGHLRHRDDPRDSAAAEARVLASLIPRILGRPGSIVYPIPPPPEHDGPPPPSPRRRRAAHATRPAPPDSWLAQLLASVPMSAKEANDPRAALYLEVLTSLLVEGRIVTDETRTLAGVMAAAGYPAGEIRFLNERLLEALRVAAFAGHRLTTTQLRHLRAVATSVGIPTYFDDLVPPPPPPAPEPGSGSFARPVRKPLPPGPPDHAPRCGHCLQVGHYTANCPTLRGRTRRESGPVRPVSPIDPI